MIAKAGAAQSFDYKAGRVAAEPLRDFVETALLRSGASEAQAASVANALIEASLRGVDSHGVRLLVHYAKVARTGRIDAKAVVSVNRTAPSTAIVDAHDGFGHHASFRAIDEGVAMARETGVAAISVVNSSHFAAAGCYVLRAADAGMVAFAFANSDSFVLPHDGLTPFHGTNPIAFAAPVAGERPFLFDMATSVVPWNRVQDRLAKGLKLPEDVAVDANGAPTTEPGETAALLPIGGVHFGYKGAGLASVLEVLSAVMTGMAHCTRLLSMIGPDFTTPRRLGHFFIVIDPERFVPKALYDAGMAAYLADLRAHPAREGASVMAPGDREWRVEEERRANGIPVAEALAAEFDALALALGMDPLVLR